MSKTGLGGGASKESKRACWHLNPRPEVEGVSAPRVFYLGTVPVYLYGMMIGLAIAVGMYFGLKEARRKGLDEEKVLDLILYMVVAGLLGARLVYVAFNLDYYLTNPLRVLMVFDGGLSFHGSVLGAVLVAVWHTRRYRLNFWKLADTFTPSLALGYAIARVGCDIFGVPTQVAWAVNIDGIPRHPVQVYASLTNYLFFFLLWKGRERVQVDGSLFLTYAILYSVYRFFIEFFRNSQMAYGLSIAQWASLGIGLGAVVLFLMRRKKGSLLT